MGKQKLKLADGFKLIQYDEHMKLGTDSVLLADFARIKRGDNICDLGCGIGCLTVLLCAKHKQVKIDAVDMQHDVIKICAKNVGVNHIGSRVNVIEADFAKQTPLLRTGNYSVVVCNPPYIPLGTGRASQVKGRMFARMETAATIEDICYTVRRLLHNGGLFFVVYRPDRLVDLLVAMHNMDIEPKRVQFVCGRADKPPTLVLVEGKRHAHTGLMMLPNLILYDDQGHPTDNLLKIYGREDLFRAVREHEEKMELEMEAERQAYEKAVWDDMLSEERRADEQEFDESEEEAALRRQELEEAYRREQMDSDDDWDDDDDDK